MLDFVYLTQYPVHTSETLKQLQRALDIRVREGVEELDIAGWMGRTALELVGQGVLGYSFDPLLEDSKDKYTEAVKSFVYVASFSIGLIWLCSRPIQATTSHWKTYESTFLSVRTSTG